MVVNSCARSAVAVNVPAETSNSFEAAETVFHDPADRDFKEIQRRPRINPCDFRESVRESAAPPGKNRALQSRNARMPPAWNACHNCIVENQKD